MGILTFLSFSILINGASFSFYIPSPGLRKGFPLAPFLFLIIVEGISRAIVDAKNQGIFHGIYFGNEISLTPALFVDDIVMVIDGS